MIISTAQAPRGYQLPIKVEKDLKSNLTTLTYAEVLKIEKIESTIKDCYDGGPTLNVLYDFS